MNGILERKNRDSSDGEDFIPNITSNRMLTVLSVNEVITMAKHQYRTRVTPTTSSSSNLLELFGIVFSVNRSTSPNMLSFSLTNTQSSLLKPGLLPVAHAEPVLQCYYWQMDDEVDVAMLMGTEDVVVRVVGRIYPWDANDPLIVNARHQAAFQCYQIKLSSAMEAQRVHEMTAQTRGTLLGDPWAGLPLTDVSTPFFFNKTALSTAEEEVREGNGQFDGEKLLRNLSLQVDAAKREQGQRPFKRLIIVLIDALRFDFLLHRDKVPEGAEYYVNHVPIIQQLIDVYPKRSLLFQFRADPPTTTMQRLKALMTGSLPTFIDAGSNFASTAIDEDNLIRHLNRSHPRIYFMGDDTWHHLYGDVLFRTDRTFPFDSFKLNDLYTVDNGVKNRLNPLLQQLKENPADVGWDVVIAHFLGVDHCGHKFGPSHPSMASKLQEINSVIEKIVNNVDKETLFVLMGDHGMTAEGDHGGDSEEELMSSLFLYSNRDLTLGRGQEQLAEEEVFWSSFHSQTNDYRSRKLGYDFDSVTAHLRYDARNAKYPMITQIQLVPTLAYLLNLPIPYGNLGALVPDLLYGYPLSNGASKLEQHQHRLYNLFHALESIRPNALQVYRYLYNYAQQNDDFGFQMPQLTPLFHIFHQAEQNVQQWTESRLFQDMIQQEGKIASADDFQQLCAMLLRLFAAYDDFMTTTLEHCKHMWAQFDVGCMYLGVATLVLCFAVSLNLVVGTIDIKANETLFGLQRGGLLGILIGSGLLLAWKAVIADATRVILPGWFMKLGPIAALFTFTSIGSMIGVVTGAVSRGMHMFSISRTPFLEQMRSHQLIIAVAVFFHSFSLASNSYIIFEDRVIRYIINSLSVYLAICQLRSSVSGQRIFSLQPIILLLYTRLTSMTGICREEQYPHCQYVSSVSLGNFWNAADTISSIAYIVGTVVFVGTTLMWTFRTASSMMHGHGKECIPTRSAEFAYGLALCALTTRWVWILYRDSVDVSASALTHTEDPTLILNGTVQEDPAMVAATMIMQLHPNLFLWLSSAFEIHIPRLLYTLTIVGIFTSAYQTLRLGETPADVHTNFMQAAWLGLLSSTITLATLQRPIGGFLIITTPIILVRLLATPEIPTSSAQTRKSVLYVRLALLHYLGFHLFFTTGHQSIITAIHWDAAFVGFRELHMELGGILVGLSTLAGWLFGWSAMIILVLDTWQACYAPVEKPRSPKKEDLLPLLQQILAFQTFITVMPTALASVFITLLRRHLMTWKIFAPRVLLQCLLLLTTDVCLLGMLVTVTFVLILCFPDQVAI